MSLQQNNNRRETPLGKKEESAFRRRGGRAVRQYHRDGNSERSTNGEEDFEQASSPFSMENLEKLVAERPHSVTAKRILKSVRCAKKGIDAIKGNNKKLAASYLAEATRKYKCGSLMKMREWNDDLAGRTMASMKALYSDTCQENQTRAEALFVHAMLLGGFYQQHQQALKQCRLAHMLLPKDPYILLAEATLLHHQEDFEASLITFEKAALLCGDTEPEISLYYPAVVLKSLSLSNDNEAISLFEKYVQCAEPDAPELPMALYTLVAKYIRQGPSSIGKAKHYFAMAEKAEERSLPLGQEVFDHGLIRVREATRTFLKNYIACGNEKCSAAATHPCGLCEQSYYCSEECLHAHWSSHKAFCKKHRKGKGGKPTTMLTTREI